MKKPASPELFINCSPQQVGQAKTSQLMLLVIAACAPAILVSTYFFGIGVLLNVAIAALIALASEAVLLKLRNRDISLHLSDNSALVTAVLLGIAVPPGAPWWLVVSGVLFAIVITKHTFGGLGQNPFNPAMCGYVMLLLSFPLEMTSWHVPLPEQGEELFNPLSVSGLFTSLQLTFPVLAPEVSNTAKDFADGMARATPLIEQKMAGNSAIVAILESDSSWSGIFERSSDTGWELVNIGFLLGGLFLLYRRVISWHIPVSIIGSIIVLSVIFFSDGGAAIYGSTYLHLFGSATMIGAFFIATDPVSAAGTPMGKIVYGLIIGCCIYCIRVWGSYLDSIAFAVLFGNFCAPLIDHLCTPTIYGRPGFKLWK